MADLHGKELIAAAGVTEAEVARLHMLMMQLVVRMVADEPQPFNGEEQAFILSMIEKIRPYTEIPEVMEPMIQRLREGVFADATGEAKTEVKH